MSEPVWPEKKQDDSYGHACYDGDRCAQCSIEGYNEAVDDFNQWKAQNGAEPECLCSDRLETLEKGQSIVRRFCPQCKNQIKIRNTAEMKLAIGEAQPEVRELHPAEIIDIALRSGFMVSSAYGQATNKLMPVSDMGTLLKFSLELKKAVNGAAKEGKG